MGVNRPGREADHTPYSAVVKNVWIYTSTHPYTRILIVWYLIKHRILSLRGSSHGGNYTFTLPIFFCFIENPWISI